MYCVLFKLRVNVDLEIYPIIINVFEKEFSDFVILILL